MLSHNVFEFESRPQTRRSLRFAPFVVLVALVLYATVIIAAVTGSPSAESGSGSVSVEVDAG